MKSRIFVADDHPVLREALASVINREVDLTCCGGAGTAADTQKGVANEKPDAILLDLCLDSNDGLELIKTLRSQFPSLRILVLSQLDETIYAERTLRAGANGYVMKEETTGGILKAIRTVLAGDIYVSPKIAAQAVNNMSGGRNKTGVECLTNRELQVFRLLGDGMGTRKIATEMGLSIKTIESHRENIKRKLGVTEASRLVHYAEEWRHHQNFQHA